MKKIINLIIAFFEAYGNAILNDKETPADRMNRTCGSEIFF